MKTLTVNSYIGFIPNPFRIYNLDFEGLGILEIEKGIFTSSGCAYDLFPISNASYKATLTQKLFGLGDVRFTVKENDQTREVILGNIRDAKYITGLLRNHHQEILEQYYMDARMVHLL